MLSENEERNLEIHPSDHSVDTNRDSNNPWCNVMYLSKHFTLQEMTRSDTATRLGICNDPGIDAISNLQNLCQTVLEPLREYARQPVRISSGYRCRALNRAVGGVRNSRHIHGEAADIAMPLCDASGRRLSFAEARATLRRWYVWIKGHCPHDELIWEERAGKPMTAWIHVAKGRR